MLRFNDLTKSSGDNIMGVAIEIKIKVKVKVRIKVEIKGKFKSKFKGFRLRRVHFFLRKKETEPKKNSPILSKAPALLAKSLAVHSGHPWRAHSAHPPDASLQ